MLILADIFNPQSLLIGDGEMIKNKQKKNIKQALPRTALLSNMNCRVRGGEGTFLLPGSAPLPPSLPPPHPPPLPLNQLVARARRLVVFYCVLCGPVHRHGPEQTAAADLEEIYEVSKAAVAGEGQREREKGRKLVALLRNDMITNILLIKIYCTIIPGSIKDQSI